MIVIQKIIMGKIFYSPAFFTFSQQKAHFPQTPFLFPHMTFQSLGYVMKRAAAFRVCPPTVLGLVRVFVRVTEMGKRKAGLGKKCFL